MGLVGKFVFHIAKDFHESGEVVEQVTPDIVMVRWDRSGGHDAGADQPPASSLNLVSVAAMAADLDEGGFPAWEFYETRAEIDAFHAWLHAPVPKKKPSPRGGKILRPQFRN